MKKKIALVMVSLLMLTLLLTMPNFTPTTTASGSVFHWRIELAQKNCNAKIAGSLSYKNGSTMPGTSFTLMCNQSFVFAKVKNETANVHDINFTKWIDWNKDGKWDVVGKSVSGLLKKPAQAYNTTWYRDVEGNATKMVVVEVHEEPYDAKRPFFEWQLSINQENCNVVWKGNLTRDSVYLTNTVFNIICSGTQMQCKVVKTPWSTIPNDISYDLVVKNKTTQAVLREQHPRNLPVTQFPWTNVTSGTGWKVELELTEVQMYQYVSLGGETDSSGQLGRFPAWYIGDWAVPTGPPYNFRGKGVPHATRAPYLTPIWFNSTRTSGQNTTFTYPDPITGIVKLSVPAESYIGLDHMYFSPRVMTYFRVRIYLLEQACGYLYTGEGVDPVLGDVDLITFNNYTGVYSFGSDDKHTPPVETRLHLRNTTKIDVRSPVCTYWKTIGQTIKEKWTGTGTQKTFMTASKFLPIKSDSEKVYVNDTLRAKPAFYTINYNTGNITFTTAPGKGAAIVAVYDIVNYMNIILHLKYWRNVVFEDPQQLSAGDKLIMYNTSDLYCDVYTLAYGALCNMTVVTYVPPDNTWNDDVLLSGRLANTLDPGSLPGPPMHAAGAGPPLGPCLQKLSGPDGIPGTGDDPVGDGTPDPAGSSILYLPTRQEVTYWKNASAAWALLFDCAWPQPMTTGNATDIVIEPRSMIDHQTYGKGRASLKGERWEFLAGVDHGTKVIWKNPYCNAYVTYVCAWSVLGTDTDLDLLDVLFYSRQKTFRIDCLTISKTPEIWFCDLDGDEDITIFDVSIPAKSYEQSDEHWLYPQADAAFDMRGDLTMPKGYVDIFDVGYVAKAYEWKLRHTGFIPPP